MSGDDLFHDVEAEAHVTTVRACVDRLEQSAEPVGRDDRPEAVNGNDAVVQRTESRHFDWRLWCSVLNGIAEKVSERLCDSVRVAAASQQSTRFNLYHAFRMGSANFCNHTMDYQPHISRLHGNRHGVTEAGARKVEEVGYQPGHASCDGSNAGNQCVIRFNEFAALDHEYAGREDRIERGAQVVAEDCEEAFLRTCHVGSESRYRLGDCLIDGFIEASHVLEPDFADVSMLEPGTDHACPQRTKLRNHLLACKAEHRAIRAVLLRGR